MSTFPENVTLKIKMIFTELIAICPLSIYVKIITKILNVACGVAFVTGSCVLKNLAIKAFSCAQMFKNVIVSIDRRRRNFLAPKMKSANIGYFLFICAIYLGGTYLFNYFNILI